MEEIVNADETMEREEPTIDVTSMATEDLRAANAETPVVGKEEPPKEEPKEPIVEKEPLKAEEPPKEDTIPKAEYDKLQKRVSDQEKFLARLGTELGLQRGHNPEYFNKRVQEIRDKYFEDPIAAQMEFETLRREKQEVDRLTAEYQVNQVADGNRERLVKGIPQFEDVIPDIAKILVEQDLEDAGWVEDFKKNPYVVRGNPIHPAVLHNLYHRVRLSKENTELKAQVDTLKAENDKLRVKPDEVLKRVERAGNPVKAAGGENRDIAVDKGSRPVWAMSTEEIKEKQKQYRTA